MDSKNELQPTEIIENISEDDSISNIKSDKKSLDSNSEDDKSQPELKSEKKKRVKINMTPSFSDITKIPPKRRIPKSKNCDNLTFSNNKAKKSFSKTSVKESSKKKSILSVKNSNSTKIKNQNSKQDGESKICSDVPLSQVSVETSIEEKSLDNVLPTNLNVQIKKKKKTKRFFRGSTYGLYLSPARKKKKKKLLPETGSKDDELSLAGSSQFDSEDSFVSEDYNTPSEKSVADDENASYSQNSPLLSNTEQKTSSLDSKLLDNFNNAQIIEKNSNLDSDLNNMHNEINSEDDTCKSINNDAVNQSCTQIFKVPEYDDISNESTNPNMSYFEDSSNINKKIDEKSQNIKIKKNPPLTMEESKDNDDMSIDVSHNSSEITPENEMSEISFENDDISMHEEQNSDFTNDASQSFIQMNTENLSMEAEENASSSDILENKVIDKNCDKNELEFSNNSDKIDEMDHISEDSKYYENDNELISSSKDEMMDDENDTLSEFSQSEDENEDVYSSSSEHETNEKESTSISQSTTSISQSTTSISQSTIASCVKSRQRIKRRFTDDVVDTDIGILSLNSQISSRKISSKSDSFEDSFENYSPEAQEGTFRRKLSKGEAVFNNRQKPVKSCCCLEKIFQMPLGNPEQIYCQACDSFEDKLIGCSNQVTSFQLVRPSVRLPFKFYCDAHLWRLQNHHACPYCGCFCTQGTFMLCHGHHKCEEEKNIESCNEETKDEIKCSNSPKEQNSQENIENVGLTSQIMHFFHENCFIKEADPDHCCLHCGSTEFHSSEVWFQSTSPKYLHFKQGITRSINKARMGFARSPLKNENEIKSNIYEIPESGKILSANDIPFGPEHDELQEMIKFIKNQDLTLGFYTYDDLYTMSAKGDSIKVLHMLAVGLNPNHKFPEYENGTALHAAAASGHLTIVHLLIQAGAIYDVFNDKICTPLMLATENDHKAVARYLVRKGALTDFRGENGMTSLHIAAKSGNLDMLKILTTSRKFNINSQDDGGWTPIVWASEHNHFHVVEYLLNRGANPDIRDNEGNTGLHWAAFSGSDNISYLYLDYGCDLNAINERGDTPLHIAARQDSYPCVVLFLSRGADINIYNKAHFLPSECCPDKTSKCYLSLVINKLLLNTISKYQFQTEKIIHRDISRGKEPIAIQCVNSIDNEPAPFDYMYITKNCITTKIEIDRTITSLELDSDSLEEILPPLPKSCHCEDDCTTNECICAKNSSRCWFDSDGCLLPDFNMIDPPILFECNRACSCWSLNCRNRILQNGITCRLQVIRTKTKGWGVRTLKDIPKGAFICEYVGEIISDSEADKRQDDSYLFDLENVDAETFCLDARRYGNISRFINHQCEPNLVPVKMYVDHQDHNFPRIAFFSAREIKQYEELGFDYGEKFWTIKYKWFTCDCGTPGCKYSKDTIQETLVNYEKRNKQEQFQEELTKLEQFKSPSELE